MSAHHVPIVILAGGAGQRLGGNKPTAQLAGRPLIEHGLARLAGQGTLYVSGDSQLAARYDLPFIADESEGNGPMGGIAAALQRAKSDGFAAIISVPCDAPFCPPTLPCGWRLHLAIW